MRERLYELLTEYYDEMVEIRRYLHENPEVSYHEVNTANYIATYQKALGHEVRTNVGGNGVVAKLHGGKPGKTIALRADFDALAIDEQNDVPYKSKKPGVMHACGHDGHTATLLVLAKALNQIKDELSGTIVFIHQHAEELAPGGAIAMIEDGCLEGVDVIYGTHLWSTEPLGSFMTKPGPLMAAADALALTVKGRGGHGSEPHLTKDAIVISSQFVINLQQLVARRVSPISPAVVSIGRFEAINPFNVIADQVEMEGTVRTFDEATRSLLEIEVEKVLAASCALTDADYEYAYKRGYPAVINHEQQTALTIDVAANVPGIDKIHICEPLMGGEDFAYYLQHVPGSFFFTGAKNPSWTEVYPHHHPKFDIDERALLNAAKTLGAITLKEME